MDTEKDEVYFTPLYYALSHFSKFIRPEATVFELENSDNEIMVTAAENPDGTIAVVVFNETNQSKNIQLSLGNQNITVKMNGQSIQTIVIQRQENKYSLTKIDI